MGSFQYLVPERRRNIRKLLRGDLSPAELREKEANLSPLLPIQRCKIAIHEESIGNEKIHWLDAFEVVGKRRDELLCHLVMTDRLKSQYAGVRSQMGNLLNVNVTIYRIEMATLTYFL